MKCPVIKLGGLSFFIFILLAVSCKKDVSLDDQNDAVFSMKFKFSGFTSQSTPFKTGVKSASSGKSDTPPEDYLYFWSFNKDNLLPDIKFNYQYTPTISYANGDLPTTFVTSTYAFDGFAGGKAISFSGSRDVIFKMPIRGVNDLGILGFDIGSPSTGPKDFELYYSVDKGISYEVLQLNNQFSDPATANFRNSYSYDLSQKGVVADELWIKLSPKAGIRGGSSNYNENSGTFRLDNLYLRGIAPSGSAPIYVNKLYYFIFDKSGQELIESGDKNWKDIDLLDIELPIGEYKICFVSNTSEAELLVPDNLTLSSFYVSNVFLNSNAEIFGHIGDLLVSKDQTVAIELERWFSQIRIEFTDGDVLDRITKIVVDQKHAPFFFAPFNVSMQNPVVDQSSIEYVQDFSVNNQIIFNQFLGRLSETRPVTYDLHVYSQEGKLKTISLSSSVKNNMQLLFKGNILNGLVYGSDFSIIKNENWGDLETVDF